MRKPVLDLEDECAKYLRERGAADGGEEIRNFELCMAGRHPVCKFGIVGNAAATIFQARLAECQALFCCRLAAQTHPFAPLAPGARSNVTS